MNRSFIGAAALLAVGLTGCMTPVGNSTGRLDHDKVSMSFASALNIPPRAVSAAPAAVVPSLPACPPELRTDMPAEPKLPADAGWPAVDATAANAAQLQAALESYGAWLKAEHEWGASGWARAALSRSYCAGQR